MRCETRSILLRLAKLNRLSSFINFDMISNRAFLSRDLFVKLETLLLRQICEMYNHFVSEPFANFLERKTFRFWEEVNHQREVNGCEDNEQQVVAPADLSKCCWSSLEVSNC